MAYDSEGFFPPFILGGVWGKAEETEWFQMFRVIRDIL